MFIEKLKEVMKLAYSTSDAEKSREGFTQFAVPAMIKHFKARIVTSIEDQAVAFEKWLDCHSTIDGLMHTAKGLLTFGSKVQRGINYSAFSIRRSRPSGRPTEYQKLKAWLDGDSSIYGAEYLVHTFVAADEKSAVVAIAETQRVMGKVTEDKVRSTKDGETFYYVPWREVEGVRVYRVGDRRQVEDVTAEYMKKILY